jgi:ABC-type nickel/cobalt efflux system permease component RcnA
VSVRTLLVLGISGGALPCPSALVVMLSAIALHRVAFGLGLVTAFSLGLAAVLTGIGLLIVHGRTFLDGVPLGGVALKRLPVLSAAVVTGIGLLLMVRAMNGSF